jgi:aspartyl/glutamyl-tRNA(Asn/Gln) amidotransferase C subunit
LAAENSVSFIYIKLMIRKEDILKLSKLARIEIESREAEALSSDLKEILDFVSKLKRAPVVKDEKERESVLSNVFRSDGNPHEPGEYSEPLIKAMPESEKGYLKTKKVF